MAESSIPAVTEYSRGSESMSPVAQCQNCQALLSGEYCAACGQSSQSPIMSVRAFVSQTANDVLSLDSRLLRTLGALLFRPGELTCAYLEGRRARYTPPVQLYLIAAAAFFLVASYRPFVWVDVARRQVTGQLPGLVVGNLAVRDRLGALAGDAAAHELFTLRFAIAVNQFLPVFLIGSVVLFSLLVYGMNFRQERRYLPHAIFALHWTAFFLLLLGVARLLPTGWLVQSAPLVPAILYLVLAQRRVYAQHWGYSVGKGFLLVLAFLLLLATWVQTAVVIGLLAV